jgi:hypothetical protein
MMAAWFIGLALYLTLILAVVVVLLMRILSLLEIVVRAIPLGSPRVQERRAPVPNGGIHRRDTQEV